MARSFDETLALILKWLGVIVIFFVVVMPAQIIWILLFPIMKIVKKKQDEKTDIPMSLNLWLPIEWYGKLSKRFIAGEV